MRHNTPIIPFLLFSLLSLAVLSLTGCDTQPSKPGTDVSIPEADAHAKELYRAGDFYAAAEEYLALAKSDPRNEIKYQLGAIDAMIKNQEIDRAQQLIDFLQPEKPSDVQSILVIIYKAQILLARDDPKAAYTLLNIDLPSETSRTVLAKFHETRATILQLEKEYFAAARERILLNSYLDDTQEISANYQSLWKSLSQIPPGELDTYRASDAGIPGSWLELAIINKTMLQNTVNLEASIATWQQRYPDHPALVDIIPMIIESSILLAEQPSQVALLLPFTGKYNDASIAIREGFMAAWYDSRDEKPIIKIYNTDTDNIVARYAQAISEGADLVVGPLQKPAISKLIEQSDITVTTLVLNQYDGEYDIANVSSPSPLPAVIQFGLSPEDEARQVAERAWFDGRARAISITTGDERSRRIQDAFASHWQELGGTLLVHVSIGQDVKQLSGPIKGALNIDQSEQRSKTLRSKLQRSLKTETRRRQDVDMIFMAVPPTIARQLVPQLRYYGTEDISLYSISNIYTGNISTREDSDINGVLFVDMPWVIDPENEYSPLNRMIERYQKPSLAAYKRLYAFGIDAYRLIPQLAELSLQPGQQYEGKTGYIKIDAEGQVQRRLIWARFVDGKPELIDTSTTGFN
jgi:outer membrane PBP1 activator LpoA protein